MAGVQDLINAGLELVGGLFVSTSIATLWRDRVLKGIHPAHVAYSATSAVWFVYYYAHLDQWFSFACAGLYALATGTWVTLLCGLWVHKVFIEKDPDL
jgi:hypothetical protein